VSLEALGFSIAPQASTSFNRSGLQALQHDLGNTGGLCTTHSKLLEKRGRVRCDLWGISARLVNR